MVVPRVERRGSAGIVATAATRAGMTPTDESLFRGAARAALAAGVPVSVRFGVDAVKELQIVLDEGLPADRVVVGDLDRKDAVAAGWPAAVAELGAYVAVDHVGRNDDDGFVTDAERAALVAELVAAGHADRVLLSCNAIGVAKGQPAYELPYAHVLTAFVPLLASHGVGEEDIQRLLVANPRDLLTVR
jgi:phosphotriesterase-related protein